MSDVAKSVFAEKRTLSCGVRFITLPSNRLTKVWFTLRLRGGQAYEHSRWQNDDTAPLPGSFALLAEMLTCGNEELNKKEMVRISKQHAVEQSALAGEAYFGFNLAYLPEKNSIAAKVIKATLSLEKLVKSDFQLELEETRHELSREQESGEKVASRAFNRLFFADSPFAESSLGTLESLQEMNATHIENVWQKHCQAKTAVAVLAGNFDKSMENAIIESLEAGFHNAKSHLPVPLLEKPSFENRLSDLKERIFLQKHSGNKQTFVKLGYAIPRLVQSDSLVGKIVQAHLSGMGGTLFKLRSAPFIKNGKDLGGRAYVMGSRTQIGYYHGGLVFYTSLREEAVDQWQWALDSFRLEVQKLCETPLTSLQLEEAKTALLAARNLHLGKIAFRASQYAVYESLGISFREWENQGELVKKITADDVQKYCNAYLTQDNCLAHVSSENYKLP